MILMMKYYTIAIRNLSVSSVRSVIQKRLFAQGRESNMFELQELYKIVKDTTTMYRKCEDVVEKKVVGNVKVTEVWGMPHINDANKSLDLIDVHFMVIGVDKKKSEKHKEKLVTLLKEFPDARFKEGLSYIDIGCKLDSQEIALRLMALCKSLGICNIVTPKTLGLEGEEGNNLAGLGFVMMSEVKVW
jgi:hypothetical protein